MSQNQMISEIQKIFRNSDAWAFGPRTEHIVLAAEKEIGLTFPTSYRAFILQFGTAKCFDLDIFGIPDTRDTDRDNHPIFLNVIDQTLSLRNSNMMRNPLPHHLIYFATDSSGGGYSFYIDTCQIDKNGDAPVLIEGPGISLQIIDRTFIDFIKKLASGHQSYRKMINEYNRSHSDKTDSVDISKQAMNLNNATPSINTKESSGRSIFWLQITPEPCPPNLSVLAQHFGVDVVTREVFIYGRSSGLNLEQQSEAISMRQGFFANPADDTEFHHPFISIDYIIERYSELNQDFLFTKLKQIVINTFDNQINN